MEQSNGGLDVDWTQGIVAGTQLRPQSLAVLKLLLENAGKVVTKDQITTSVWPGVAVTDDSLVQCIIEVRRAIGDRSHTLIKTLPKRGYIYQPQVRKSGFEDVVARVMPGRAKWIWSTAVFAAAAAGALLLASFWPKNVQRPAELPAIAVLPFTNLGADGKGEQFADMMTEDVITDLSHSKDFAVIARNSTEVYKGKPIDVRDVGGKLRVKYIVEGSTQLLPDRVRATVQFIDAETGQHVWSQRVEKQGDDVFAVEAELTVLIAQQIVGQDKAATTDQRNLIRRKPPSQWGAYDLYQLGQEAMNSETDEGYKQAEAYFQKSIEIDPNFARAHIGLAYVTVHLLTDGMIDEAKGASRMLQSALRAVELDPLDGDAHAALGAAYSWNGNADRMMEHAMKAAELAPNNADVLINCSYELAASGKKEASIANVKRALRLNPSYPIWYNHQVRNTAFVAGDHQLSYEFGKSEKNESATDFEILAINASQLGKEEEAHRAKLELLKAVPDWSAEDGLTWWVFREQEDRDRFVASVEKLGLPKCMPKAKLAETLQAVTLPQCDAERAKQP